MSYGSEGHARLADHGLMIRPSVLLTSDDLKLEDLTGGSRVRFPRGYEPRASGTCRRGSLIELHQRSLMEATPSNLESPTTT